jgi:hypothetical protein
MTWSLLWQIWKEKVLPHILKELAEQISNINIHLVLYQEATIINLLEVFWTYSIVALRSCH